MFPRPPFMKSLIATSAVIAAGSAAFADDGPVRRYMKYVPAPPITRMIISIRVLRFSGFFSEETKSVSSMPVSAPPSWLPSGDKPPGDSCCGTSPLLPPPSKSFRFAKFMSSSLALGCLTTLACAACALLGPGEHRRRPFRLEEDAQRHSRLHLPVVLVDLLNAHARHPRDSRQL